MTRLTWGPRPSMKRSPDISSRSQAVIAVTVGERGKASATAVPTPIVEVAAIAAAAWTSAVRSSSATQTDSMPADSARAASDATSRRVPPTAIPIFMPRLYRLATRPGARKRLGGRGRGLVLGRVTRGRGGAGRPAAACARWARPVRMALTSTGT
jgi:hypothetical protein